MGSDTGEVTGPDLTEGIASGSLVEGRPFLGHVHGEPVVLVRCEGSVYAVGGRCSHYGAPLEGGLVIGCTLRCPWHHASFDLRTGEATRAPALNPLPTYVVESHGERLMVGAKHESAPLSPLSTTTAPPRPPTSVVIIGAGAAGSSAVEMLRRQSYSGPITLVDPVDDEPVDRPNLSKDFLVGGMPEEWIPLRPSGFYEAQGVERIRTAALGIEPPARTVLLADGRRLGFDRLLLATGAQPIRLRIPGSDLPHVRVLRTLRDARAITALADGAGRVVVIGSSFIGMETAAALAERGLPVSVASLDRVPFERVLGAELGGLVRGRFEARGIEFHLQTAPARITAEAVVLNNGTRLPAGLVVVGIGVRPRLGLARRAGLAVDEAGGIRVDGHLETSAPGIYAAGDVAAWPDARSGRRIRVEHWVVAQRQGQVAARNMLGHGEVFDAVPFFWTSFAGLSLQIRYIGTPPDRDARARVAATGDRLVAVLHEGERISAVATVGDDRASLLAERALETGDEAALRTALQDSMAERGR